MLPSEKSYLVTELNKVLSGLNDSIDETHVIANEWDIDVHVMRSPDGRLMLAPLLISKAEVLMTLAALKKD